MTIASWARRYWPSWRPFERYRDGLMFPGELVPRVGFIATNLTRPGERVVKFYNGRGTAERWIKIL